MLFHAKYIYDFKTLALFPKLGKYKKQPVRAQSEYHPYLNGQRINSSRQAIQERLFSLNNVSRHTYDANNESNLYKYNAAAGL